MGPREGSDVRGPGEKLLSGEVRDRRILGRSVAPRELGGAELTPVGDETVDVARALGERLAENHRAAVLSGALAGGRAARPGDVTGDEPLRDGDGGLGGIGRGRGRSSGDRNRAKGKNRTKHRTFLLF